MGLLDLGMADRFPSEICGKTPLATAILGGTMRALVDIAEFVDTEAYPLLQEGTSDWVRSVDRIRRELAAVDCSVLSGFISRHRLTDLIDEGRAIAPLAWSRIETVNAYNIA